jgi:hypothetical protein
MSQSFPFMQVKFASFVSVNCAAIPSSPIMSEDHEFAENSPSFNGFRARENRVDLVFFPRKSAFRTLAGIRYANAADNERNLNP